MKDFSLRRNTGIFGIIIILLLMAFISFGLKGDYADYIANATNAMPFYMFAIRKLLIPILVLVFLVIRFIKESTAKNNNK